MVLDGSPGEMKFEPSDTLKQAREVTEIAQHTGHPRPILSYEGLYTFFNVLEQEERKVFDLQVSTGRLAFELDKSNELVRRLFEIVKSEAFMHGGDGYECFYCEAHAESIEDIHHEKDCIIEKAGRIANR